MLKSWLDFDRYVCHFKDFGLPVGPAKSVALWVFVSMAYSLKHK